MLPAFEKNIYDQKKEMISELTNSAWNILAKFEADEKKGLLTRDQAQKAVIAQIHSLHYGNKMKDYFWINDMHPKMIIHPYRIDLNGKDLSDFKDPEGKKLFVEMVETVKKDGAGFVDYMWQLREEENKVVPKISYVKGFAPWGWIIGTGIYIYDVQDEIKRIKRNLIQISIIIILLSTVVLVYLMLEYMRTELGRANAVEALKYSEKKYRTLVENNNDVIMRLDNKSRVLYSNPSIEKYAEIKAESLSGKNLKELELPVELRQFFENAIKKVIDTNQKYGLESTMPGKTGETVFNWLLYPEFDESETNTHILCIGRDITEIKHKEKIIRQQVKELEEKNAELESFNYTVSHELKSPIITMQGYLGLVNEHIKQGKSERIVSDIKKMENAANKMYGLLECLLKLSRLGKITGLFEKIQMKELINETIELLNSNIKKANIKINILSDMPEIKADRQRIREVVQNLIENAIKYIGTQTEPEIKIGFTKEENEHCFYIKDNGIGIEKAYLEKIFNLFEKLNPRSDGNGIGLAVSKKIIDYHGGRIWAESEGKNKGCAFYFTIPIIAVEKIKI